MRIAVDFDGTVVEHRYPEMGDERPMATMTLRQLQEEGHQLILWTVREGELLTQAVEWCRERGVEFYAVNANYPDQTEEDNHYARKITADLYIDDRNVGGLPHWSVIYQLIHRGYDLQHYIRKEVRMEMERQAAQKPKSLWQRLFAK